MACLSRNLGVGQHFQDAFRKVLVDLGVPRNRLRNLRGGVVIPVVLSAVADQQAADSFELPDEVLPLHRSVSSASLRTPGMAPLVRS